MRYVNFICRLLGLFLIIYPVCFLFGAIIFLLYALIDWEEAKLSFGYCYEAPQELFRVAKEVL